MEITPAEQAHGAARGPTRVIGFAASAGGVEAIRRVVSELPADLPAALCVVLHIPASGRSLLAPILDRHSPLHAVLASDGAALEAGTIFVAPADHHLLVRGAVVELTRDPKENGVRPAADPLFRSLAAAWGPRAIAVVLSGALDDGSAGAVAVAQAGGTVIVQSPEDALVPGMPSSAIAARAPDHVLPIGEIAALLCRLVGEDNPGDVPPAPTKLHEPGRPEGPASGYTCPECSGALWELREGELLRYRCRVGHSYSEEAMVDAQGASVEAALWAALEVLEERSELLTRFAERMRGTARSHERFRAGARDAGERAELIRRALALGHGPSVADAGEELAS
jgi:two-component system chemotaxis response regulator CheB